MRSTKKRVLATILTVVMVFSMLPFTVMAEENGEHEHSWRIDEMSLDCIVAGCIDCDEYVSIDVQPYGPEIKIIADKWYDAGLSISEIWYEGINSTSYSKSNVAPKALGEYKVTIVALGETLIKECVITDDCKNNEHSWNIINEYDSVTIACKNSKCSHSLMPAELYLRDDYNGFNVFLYGITGEEDYESYFNKIGFDYLVTYEGIGSTVYPESQIKPTKVGKYKATFDLEGKKIEKEFLLPQDCKSGNHKWQGKTEKLFNYSLINLACQNDLCSYSCYRKANIKIKNNYHNYIGINYDEECEAVGLEKPKFTYESIAPSAGKITNTFPTEVGDYKVTVSIEGVECETTLKFTTTYGESIYGDPYGGVEYIGDKKVVMGLPTTAGVNDEYYEKLNVRNEGINATTDSKKQILKELGDKEKAIFASMDLYACTINDLNSNLFYEIEEDMSCYFDFSKIVYVENTQKDIEVYFNVYEFILGKEDFSDSNLKVLRNHNGNVKVLETEVKKGYFIEGNYPMTGNLKEKTRIYFKTDKFSEDTTYALVYTETEEDTSCKCTSLTEVKGKEATCTEDGTKSYYKCAGCDKKYADEEGKQEIEDADLVEKAKGHKLSKVEEKKATCTEDGTKAYYTCSECNKKFEDADGKKEIQDTDIPVKAEGHKLTAVQEKKATCTEDGTKAHYACSECNKKYEDAEGKKELQEADLIIKSANGQHKEVVIPGYEATCCSTGLTDGKKCSECGEVVEAQKTIDKTEHLLLYIPGEAATYTHDGYKAYYECYYCRSMFADWSGTVETNYNLIKINKLQVGVTKSIKAKTRKSSSITFTWNKVSGATGYRVYIAKNGKWVQLKSATTATSYTAKKLSAGTSYKFAVKAYKKVNGKAVWSNTFKTVTIKTLPGKTSKITSKSAGKGKVTLTWNKVKGASGYRLYYKQGKKWVTLKSSMSGNKIKVTGLKAGKKYTFAVKAYAKENGKTVWSDVMTSKSVTAPKK